ncbi:HEAT repeat domain-containing protein [Pendulispora albinea]|uniref:HEAT repeat domain-containing protein n=1 Tax=Pendulispora albinea TaxID=2741071 RepID=A0ABZ2LXX5_9BACT
MKRIMKPKFVASIVGAFVACAALLNGTDARSDATEQKSATSVYGYIPPDQIEFLSTPERIVSIASSSGSPAAIWETLEHGEKVECLECIAPVAKLLYDANAETREIAAWWLRRRIFGVFGPGEVYEQTLKTLKGDADPKRRAYAAEALGEFLAKPGIDACGAAVTADPDPAVRVAAANALGRLHDDAGGALTKALTDGDANVKIAALGSGVRINGWTGVAHVAPLTGDGDPLVRRRAVQVLDTLQAKGSVASVIALAKSDPDPEVRLSACHALGVFHDPSARPVLEQIAASDSNSFVRDQARIALRRL